MLLEEALKIRDILAKLDLNQGQSLWNVGSSTEVHRCLVQPYNDYYVFRPLREKGIRITHLDRKDEKGVDIVCDICNEANNPIFEKTEVADVVLCTNLLEHVVDRNIVLKRLKDLVKKNGFIILTVPHKLQYHPDPVDTLYRPSNSELEALFPEKEFKVIISEVIEIKSQFLPIINARYIYRLPLNLRIALDFIFRILNRILSIFFDRLPKMALVVVKKVAKINNEK